MLLAVCGCSAANVARKWCYCSLTGAGALLSLGTFISRVDIDSNEGKILELWKKWAIIGQFMKLPPATRRAETPLLPGEAALILANSTLG